MKTLTILILAIIISHCAVGYSYDLDSKVVLCTSKGKKLTEGHFETMHLISQTQIGKQLDEKEIQTLKKELIKSFVLSPETTIKYIETFSLNLKWSNYNLIPEDNNEKISYLNHENVDFLHQFSLFKDVKHPLENKPHYPHWAKN